MANTHELDVEKQNQEKDCENGTEILSVRELSTKLEELKGEDVGASQIESPPGKPFRYFDTSRIASPKLNRLLKGYYEDTTSDAQFQDQQTNTSTAWTNTTNEHIKPVENPNNKRPIYKPLNYTRSAIELAPINRFDVPQRRIYINNNRRDQDSCVPCKMFLIIFLMISLGTFMCGIGAIYHEDIFNFVNKIAKNQ